MSFRFESKDFLEVSSYWLLTDRARAAQIANQILNEHISTLPEVFTYTHEDHPEYSQWSYGIESAETHKARLWGIEKIYPKKKCEHKVSLVRSDHNDQRFKGIFATCDDCGEKLIARWEIANED